MTRMYDPDDPDSVAALERGEAVFFEPDSDPVVDDESGPWPAGWTDIGYTTDDPDGTS